LRSFAWLTGAVYRVRQVQGLDPPARPGGGGRARTGGTCPAARAAVPRGPARSRIRAAGAASPGAAGRPGTRRTALRPRPARK